MKLFYRTTFHLIKTNLVNNNNNDDDDNNNELNALTTSRSVVFLDFWGFFVDRAFSNTLEFTNSKSVIISGTPLN